MRREARKREERAQKRERKTEEKNLYQFNFGMSHKIMQIKRISSRHDRPISKSEVRQYFKEGNRANGWDGSLSYSE